MYFNNYQRTRDISNFFFFFFLVLQKNAFDMFKKTYSLYKDQVNKKSKSPDKLV